MRREPVDSSRRNFERNAPRPISSMSSSTRLATCSSESNAIGRCSAALTGSADVDEALERHGHRLLDGHGREQPGVLERAAEPAQRPLVRRELRMSWPARMMRPASCGREPGDDVEQRRLAGAVRADDADDLARRDLERHLVDGADAAERTGQPALERDALEPLAPRATVGGRLRAAGCAPVRPFAGLAGALEEHRAQEVGPLEQLRGGPEKRISPFSMKYAVSATVRATFTDCSTRMIVVPCVLMLAQHREQLLDDHRRQAERQLVDHQQPRLGEERHAQREHLLLAAGQVGGRLVRRSPRTGNSS